MEIAKILEIIVVVVLLPVAGMALRSLYKKNYSYYRIVKEFNEKLPRKQIQAQEVPTDQLEKYPLLSESAKMISVINTQTHKSTVTETELNAFYRKLEGFDYSFVFFKKYYQDYTRNLERFNPRADDKNFDLIVLQIALKDNLIPLKPFDIFKLHLKWKWKFTAIIYSWLIERPLIGL